MQNVYLLIRLSYLIRLCNSRFLKYYTCVRAIIEIGRFLGMASVDALHVVSDINQPKSKKLDDVLQGK